MNSVDVAQGSMQVVMMYLTGVSLFELSWIKEGKKGSECKSVSEKKALNKSYDSINSIHIIALSDEILHAHISFHFSLVRFKNKKKTVLQIFKIS